MTYQEWRDQTAAAAHGAFLAREVAEWSKDNPFKRIDIEAMRECNHRAGALVDLWKRTLAP